MSPTWLNLYECHFFSHFRISSDRLFHIYVTCSKCTWQVSAPFLHGTPFVYGVGVLSSGLCSGWHVLAVLGGWLVKAFVNQYINFDMSPCFNWQPVQFHQYWGNMVMLFSIFDEPCCTILYHLEEFSKHNYVGMPKRMLIVAMTDIVRQGIGV